MRRRSTLPLVLLGLGATACTPSRPDIVLISIDSLRADHLGAYGYAKPTSPTFDALAAGGVLFEQAVSTTSWTLPAHAALFTGLYDAGHGVVRDDVRLASNRLTLAEALSEAGYTTAGFYGGPYLSPGFGIAQGFDVWTDCQAPLPRDVTGRALHEASHAGVTGPRTLEAVERWLSIASEAPFFLFVHLFDVHYDYRAPLRYREMFDPGYEGPVDGARFESREIRPDMPERDHQRLLALYDGEIRFTDDILSGLLQLLERAGRRENTLIVVTADHGDEFFEHGDKGHEKTLFEEVVRIPLLFHWPERIREGIRVAEQVRLIDVMPTVLALAGVEAPADADGSLHGRDLSPALLGAALPAETALMELHMLRRRTLALRGDDWVIIAPKEGRPELYDLAVDPQQRNPLGPEDPRYADAVRALQREARRARDYFREHPPRGADAEIDEATRRRLESLGYVAPP